MQSTSESTQNRDEEVLEKTDYNYKLTIKMSEEALQKLKDANLNLCLIKKTVSCEPLGDLLPTIWVSTPDFGTETVFTWSQKYGAYLSTFKRDEVITPDSSYPLGFNETLVFSEDEDKILAEVKKSPFSVPNALTFWNDTKSEVTAGLLQNITLNGKELGLTPITVQTLRKYSAKTLYLPERILVTFVPPTVKAGQVMMKYSGHPAMLVNVGYGANEKKIIWTIRRQRDNKLLDPGAFYTEEDGNWGILIYNTNLSLPKLLTDTDGDPSKKDWKSR